MATAIECITCSELSFDCCGGGTSNILYSGLKITIDGTVHRIEKPFTVYQDTDSFVLSDWKHNLVIVDATDTGQTTLEIKQIITRCLCSEKVLVQDFGEMPVGTAVLEVTNFVLPNPATETEAEIRRRLRLYRGGTLARYLDDYTIDFVNNEIELVYADPYTPTRFFAELLI